MKNTILPTVIFGGSFDPVHSGHLFIAQKCLEFADTITFVPCWQNPFVENKPQASAEERMEMLRLATKHEPRFILSDIEYQRDGKSYTINTIEYFYDKYKQKPGLLLGADSFLTFENWKDPKKILKLAQVFVYSRPGISNESIESLLQNKLYKNANVNYIKEQTYNISSTQIKIYCFLKEDIHEFVPKPVAEYIQANKLYQMQEDLSVIQRD
ncbi:MAG: nicotinate (nicotinamide) nucleotide adenylyltransferase [Candidatus Margulisbacteria bacterium]|nr:nicotinate (nicotinamide) nucleotide adenylyltransferase [Candidatus Margulisiibacteriota bacterium]